MARQSKNDIILRTFKVQWINHPKYGNTSQFIAEDLLFEDIAISLSSFAYADDLDYTESCICFVEKKNMCIITRTNDILIPFNDSWGLK